LDEKRIAELLSAARLALPADARLDIRGADPILASRFAVGEAAALALGLLGAAAARLHALRGGESQTARVEVRAAAAGLLGFLLQSVSGRPDLARLASPVTALYETGDGSWIHLHGGFPHLRDGTLSLLGCADDSDAIARAVRRWRSAGELEDALAERGLCGARARTIEEWAKHPQALAIAERPVVEVLRIGDGDPQWPGGASSTGEGAQPMAGVRALDLTRVLAGPSCGRALAELGADVLRIGAERLPSIEPFVIETGRGKRNAFLDLDRPAEAERLRALAHEADVFVQGYRGDRLARRGLGPEALAKLRPGIIYVSINCYGHEGPWAGRPGWEQLAQTASGLAHAEGGGGPPRLIPAAATDYTTGNLAAFGIATALARRATEGGSWWVRASLSQTAMWLTRLGADQDPAAATGWGDLESLQQTSETEWGAVTHLAPLLQLERTPLGYARPPAPLGAHAPEWLLDSRSAG
jgi:crotonobetainyl-CoA:carnitine CoA-transferase CaiB-like acyl-CoA transferase